MKYDSADEAESLIYNVHPPLSEYDDAQSADIEQEDAINPILPTKCTTTTAVRRTIFTLVYLLTHLFQNMLIKKKDRCLACLFLREKIIY